MGGGTVARTTADLQADVRWLLAEVEGGLLEAGGQLAAGELLATLRQIACRLATYRPTAVPPDLLEIEIALGETRARLEVERRQLRWHTTRPVARLLTYQVLWLAVIVLAAVLGFTVAVRLPETLQVLLGCLGWGAIGAIFCSIGALVRRGANRTLSPQYENWHLMKPLVGAFSGGVTYLIMAGGINFFEPGDTITGTGADGVVGFFGVVAPKAYLAYLLAVLMGYQERAFFDRMEQLIKTLLGSAAATPPPVVICCCRDKGVDCGELAPAPGCGRDGACGPASGNT